MVLLLICMICLLGRSTLTHTPPRQRGRGWLTTKWVATALMSRGHEGWGAFLINECTLVLAFCTYVTLFHPPSTHRHSLQDLDSFASHRYCLQAFSEQRQCQMFSYSIHSFSCSTLIGSWLRLWQKHVHWISSDRPLILALLVAQCCESSSTSSVV